MKTVQAYDYLNERIYVYTDAPHDTLKISDAILDEARIRGSVYFNTGNKDVIAYHYIKNDYRVVMVVGAVDGDGRLKLQHLRLILWLSLIGGLLITILGGYIFSERLLRPIRKIADDVNEISARSLTRRISGGKRNDEWNYLSATLNRLLNRLQDSFEDQQRFIANASHELSTPLTAISSQLEVSLQRDREAAEYRRVMKSVYQDVRHLNKLTQTLLEFASVSGNSGGIAIDRVRIDEILLRLPGELSKMDKEYSVSLDFKNLPPEDDFLLVWGNEELLFLAIQNIVSNACKYSTDHKARVKLAAGANEIHVHIQDEGIGVTADEQNKIFLPFYRSPDDQTVKGFGLGLSLASRIIKLHKGRIAISSAPGQGSTFTITLPNAYILAPGGNSN
jgi:signal transduction histidine kinase